MDELMFDPTLEADLKAVMDRFFNQGWVKALKEKRVSYDEKDIPWTERKPVIVTREQYEQASEFMWTVPLAIYGRILETNE